MFPATSFATQTFTAIERLAPELIMIGPPPSRGVGFVQTRSNVGRARGTCPEPVEGREDAKTGLHSRARRDLDHSSFNDLSFQPRIGLPWAGLAGAGIQLNKLLLSSATLRCKFRLCREAKRIGRKT